MNTLDPLHLPLRQRQIIEASDTWTKLDSTTIEFRVDVAPDTERILTYTVRYTTP